MLIGTRVRLVMAAEDLAKIDQEAGKYLRKRSEVIVRIMRLFFSRKRRPPLFPKIEFDLRLLPAGHREKVEQRQRIVQAWHRARLAGRARGETIRKLAGDFLARLALQEIHVSRRTLDYWTSRYARQGLPGLLGGRMREDL
jgi:hypothetical protein